MPESNGFIMEARKNSTVIASMMILAHHQTLYYKFGYSLEDYLDYRPNNLLFHQLYNYASENGFLAVGLGLSGVSKSYEGLVRFKEYMGGIPNNIYSFRINPENYDNAAEEQLNKFTSSLTKTIVSQQPDRETADAYSETLYPYFA
jgi:lipid II:glycine glycyltransferase (peptidoglycan interpeptide bridge formation enzyme)